MSCGASLAKPDERVIQRAKLILPNNAEIAIQNDEVTIGRKDVLNVIDQNLTGAVSREHFKIINENGEFFIVDDASTNGTMLNGEEIKGKGKQVLRDGAVISIAGKIKLTFKS
jgi:pSer/pThr/pTyr-binding forkhead associated (FHA) protein